ncbi:hypothetical protein ACWD04_09925 [Streptomyces sp. NPDC002911]
MSTHAHVVLQVIPFPAGAFAGSGQSIYYIHGAVPQLDSVNLDQSHGPVSSTRKHSCRSTESC